MMRSPIKSEDRGRVQGRAGTAGDPQGRGDEQELPAPVGLAGGGQFLDLQVVEQVEADRIQRQGVDREVEPGGGARRDGVVAVRTERGDAAVGEKPGA
jgi:hypothetical protein